MENQQQFITNEETYLNLFWLDFINNEYCNQFVKYKEFCIKLLIYSTKHYE